MMNVEQVPHVLNWGSAPFAVSIRSSKPIVYSHGLELEVELGPELVFIETLRVTDGVTEHRFRCEEVCGEWRQVRVHAFQDCVGKAGKTLPTKRRVIFGPSHASIQQGLLERFPNALNDINPVTDAEANVTRKVRRANGKRVTWGDEKASVVEGPCDGHKYGGWGLNAFCIIPNRDELRQLCMSLAEQQVERADLDEYSFFEDNEDEFMQNQLSLLTYDAEEEEVNLDDDKTIFPTEEPTEVEMEDEDEDLTDPDSPDVDETVIPQSDSEEEPTEVEVSSRKRFKMDAQDDCGAVEKVAAVQSYPTKAPMMNLSASCRSSEEELRECDFWLLENLA